MVRLMNVNTRPQKRVAQRAVLMANMDLVYIRNLMDLGGIHEFLGWVYGLVE